MSFTDQINNDIKQAMLAKDSVSLNALRSIKSALLLAKTETGSGEITDETVLGILQKMVKQRKDSIAVFEQQNRADLAEEEKAQLNVVMKYLPKQLDESEIKAIVQAAVNESGASGIKDMGKVMGLVTKQIAGKADNKTVSAIVKELLGA